jgi:hypothetical protein
LDGSIAEKKHYLDEKNDVGEIHVEGSTIFYQSKGNFCSARPAGSWKMSYEVTHKHNSLVCWGCYWIMGDIEVLKNYSVAEEGRISFFSCAKVVISGCIAFVAGADTAIVLVAGTDLAADIGIGSAVDVEVVGVVGCIWPEAQGTQEGDAAAEDTKLTAGSEADGKKEDWPS